ncbi:MAG: class I SAM-dependent methyltransferase [Planctomycetota bacterium]
MTTTKTKADGAKPSKDKASPKKRTSRSAGADAKKDGKKRDRRMNAKNADRYELYQRAVNSPGADVDFLDKAFQHYRGRDPQHFREDFCGTSAMCAEWLKRDPARTAEGVDLDPEPIEWGKKHNFKGVDDWETRMTWHVADVRQGVDRRPDVTAAQNFSYWCFYTRKDLLEYFRAVHADLGDEGIFVLDLYGGPEATIEQEEVRSLGGGIEYVWDQREYIPGTGRYFTAIHFRFRDGSEMTNAFEYEWRYWTLNEIRDVLYDAGFADVTSWFEGTDPEDEDEGDGNFELDARGENCEAWIGYLVAAK